MLDFIYYPVSFILWCWHEVFGFLLGESTAFAWAASIVFLVFTLRVILLKPAINQVRSMRKMRDFGPQLDAVRQKYPNDRQRQRAGIQQLQREHGVNPLGGCLPVVLQIPVFIGLSNVLRTFAYYPNRPNYFFPLHDVHSYLQANIFGAHLGDAILNTSLIAGHALHHALWMWQVAPVAIPLMIIAALVTHFNARLSMAHSRPASGPGGASSRLVSRFAMWVVPLGALVFGGALPVGLLLYWVSNNLWTLGQQHFVFRRVDREQRAEPGTATGTE